MIVFAVVVALGGIGGATATSHSCTSLILQPVADHYLDVRDDNLAPNIGNIWIYQETNGIEGLQKGGAGDEGCEEYDESTDPPTPIPPDTVIF